uniref:Uncharacterized protein n=1 Tax=Arundo donax TaxID=35708 RepID=A0A0A9AG99_ARUDO
MPSFFIRTCRAWVFASPLGQDVAASRTLHLVGLATGFLGRRQGAGGDYRSAGATQRVTRLMKEDAVASAAGEAEDYVTGASGVAGDTMFPVAGVIGGDAGASGVAGDARYPVAGAVSAASMFAVLLLVVVEGVARRGGEVSVAPPRALARSPRPSTWGNVVEMPVEAAVVPALASARAPALGPPGCLHPPSAAAARSCGHHPQRPAP